MRSSSVMSASFFEKVMKLLIDYFQLTVRRPAQLTRSYLAQILLPLPNPFKPLTIRKPKSSTNKFEVMTHANRWHWLKDQPREPLLMLPYVWHGTNDIVNHQARRARLTSMHNVEQSLARDFVNAAVPAHLAGDLLPSYTRRQRGSIVPYLHHYNASRML